MKWLRFLCTMVVVVFCLQNEVMPMMSRFAGTLKPASIKQKQFGLNRFPKIQNRCFHGSFDDHKRSWLLKEQLHLLAQKIGCTPSEVKRLIKNQSIDFAEKEAGFWFLQKDTPEDILLDYISDDVIHRVGDSSKPPLWYAVALNNTAAFEALIKMCKDDVAFCDDDGITLLVKALWNRNAQIVKGLLKAGANPNVYYSEKRCGEEVFKVTPLRLAVAQRDLRMTKKLLKYGAKVTYPYPEYKQELISLAMYQYPDNLYGGEINKVSDPCKVDKIVALLEKSDLETFKALIKGWYHQD
jgi:hypothetical protein